MLLSKTHVSIKAEVSSWNYIDFISYFHSSFILFSFQSKQSHCPGLQPNLFVVLNLCANNGHVFLQLNSAVLSQVRNSACWRNICESLSPCAHRQTVWMFTKSQVPKQMHSFFLLQKWVSSPFYIYIPSTHLPQKLRHKLSNFNDKHVDAALDTILRVFHG